MHVRNVQQVSFFVFGKRVIRSLKQILCGHRHSCVNNPYRSQVALLLQMIKVNTGKGGGQQRSHNFSYKNTCAFSILMQNQIAKRCNEIIIWIPKVVVLLLSRVCAV